MQDPFFGFGRFTQGGFGGGQTRVTRRVYVSNDSPTEPSTLDPFPTFQPMLPTGKPPMSRFFDDDDDDDDDSPPSRPSKPNSFMITRRYYIDGYHKPPPKAKAPPWYDEYNKPPLRANPPMISGGYYGYPPRHDPAGGNPVNVHVNLSMGPQGLQAPEHNANRNDNTNRNDNRQAEPPGRHPHNPQVQEVIYGPNGCYDSETGPPRWRQYNPQVQGVNYIPNGYYNSQTGGGDYNPQVQGGNKVDGDGKITLGPEIGNIKMGGGKAGGGQTGGGNYNANSNYNA